MAELEEIGISCGKAQAAVKDNIVWWSIVVVLCPTGGEEDKQVNNNRKGKYFDYLKSRGSFWDNTAGRMGGTIATGEMNY